MCINGIGVLCSNAKKKHQSATQNIAKKKNNKYKKEFRELI